MTWLSTVEQYNNNIRKKQQQKQKQRKTKITKLKETRNT
jgi:hypothetical protein